MAWTPFRQAAAIVCVGCTAFIPLYAAPFASASIAASFGVASQEIATPQLGERLGLIVLALVGGFVADRAGTKRIALAGLAVVTAACIACALAPGAIHFRAAELALLAGAVLALPAILAWSLTRIDVSRRGKLTCLWNLLGFLSGSFALLFHSVLMEDLFGTFPVWRQDFLVCAGLLAAALLFAVWIPQRPPATARAADVFGDDPAGPGPPRPDGAMGAGIDGLGLVAAALGFMLVLMSDLVLRRLLLLVSPLVSAGSFVAVLATAAGLFFVIDRIGPRRLCLASAIALALLGAVLAIWSETFVQLGRDTFAPPIGVAGFVAGLAYAFAIVQVGGTRLSLATAILVAALLAAGPAGTAAADAAARFGSVYDVRPFAVVSIVLAAAAICARFVGRRLET